MNNGAGISWNQLSTAESMLENITEYAQRFKEESHKVNYVKVFLVLSSLPSYQPLFYSFRLHFPRFLLPTSLLSFRLHFPLFSLTNFSSTRFIYMFLTFFYQHLSFILISSPFSLFVFTNLSLLSYAFLVLSHVLRFLTFSISCLFLRLLAFLFPFLCFFLFRSFFIYPLSLFPHILSLFPLFLSTFFFSHNLSSIFFFVRFYIPNCLLCSITPLLPPSLHLFYFQETLRVFSGCVSSEQRPQNVTYSFWLRGSNGDQ